MRVNPDNEGEVYRSAITPALAPSRQTSVDEEQFSTLKAVRNLMQIEVDALHKDFNAFDILRADTAKKRNDFILQVQVKQGIYQILGPLLEEMNKAIDTVDRKYREMNNG